MSVIRITDAERRQIIATRPVHGGERSKEQRGLNRSVFQSLKSKYGIPSNHKVKVEIDSQSNPDYLVLKNKDSGVPYEDLTLRGGTPIKAPVWAEAPRVVLKVPAMAPPMPKQVLGFTARVSSINVEDALQLLRAEGDACDSFATSVDQADGKLYLKNGRLYFLA
jgi:hypothetical protein